MKRSVWKNERYCGTPCGRFGSAEGAERLALAGRAFGFCGGICDCPVWANACADTGRAGDAFTNEEYTSAAAAGDMDKITEVSSQIAASDGYMILMLVSCIMMTVVVCLFCKIFQKRGIRSVGFSQGACGKRIPRRSGRRFSVFFRRGTDRRADRQPEASGYFLHLPGGDFSAVSVGLLYSGNGGGSSLPRLSDGVDCEKIHDDGGHFGKFPVFCGAASV